MTAELESPGPVGPVGPPGAVGPQGAAGPGVPAGGNVGDELVKSGAGDYQTGWAARLALGVATALALSSTAAAGTSAAAAHEDHVHPAVAVASTAASVALIAKGAAAQAGDLFQTQTSAGAVKSYFRSDGSLKIDKVGDATGSLTFTQGDLARLVVTNTGVQAQAQAVGDVILRVKAVASQTGDYQQWIASTGTPTVKLTANGTLDMSAGGDIILGNNKAIHSDTGPVRMSVPAGQTWNLQISNQTALQIADNLVGSVQAFAQNAAAPALIVRAKSAQSANSFEVQDVFSNLLLGVTATGQILGGAGLSVGSTRTVPADGQFRMGSSNPQLYWDRTGAGGDWLMYTAASTTMYLRDGVNGRMAQEWAAGVAGAAYSQIHGQCLVIPETAAQVPLVLRGFAAQSGNFQQCQTSAGTTLYAVTSAGLPKWADASTTQTTVGPAGTAAAPPASPARWLKVVDNAGATLVVPAYLAA